MQRESSRRPQITDVAANAGVSVSTVSRVMNGNATVAPELAERVRAAARALGYRASPSARGLALGRTHTVAVVVPDLANPGFQDSLRAITAAAARDGYRVLVADTAEDVAQEPLIVEEARRHCDALVLCAPRMGADDLRALVPELAPMVLLHRDDAVGVPTATADYRSGIIELARHLYALGHRRIAFLAGPVVSTSNRLRLAGIDEFLGAHPDASVTVLPAGSGFAHGHASGPAVLASGATGVLAFNDLVAMGLLSALHEAGVQIPGEISVAGFDDIPFARYTTPPLTTASVPTSVLGEEAWRRLRSLLAGQVPAPDLSLHPRLQARSSTGPPPEPGTRTGASVLTREGTR